MYSAYIQPKSEVRGEIFTDGKLLLSEEEGWNTSNLSWFMS